MVTLREGKQTRQALAGESPRPVARDKTQTEPSGLTEWTRRSVQFKETKLARIFRGKKYQKRESKHESKVIEREKDRHRERETDRDRQRQREGEILVAEGSP